LVTLTGELAEAVSVEPETAPPGEHFTTYNPEVEEDHTYHVGTAGVWVHNISPDECLEIARLAAEGNEASLSKLKRVFKKNPGLRKQVDLTLREIFEHDGDLLKKIDEALGGIGPNSKSGTLTFNHTIKPGKTTDLSALQSEIQLHVDGWNEILRKEGMKGLKRRLHQWEQFGDKTEAAGRKYTKSLGSADDGKVWPHYPDMAAGGRPKSAVGSPTHKRLNSIIGGQANALRQAILEMDDDVAEIVFKLNIR
jgi:hypothetical protein